MAVTAQVQTHTQPSQPTTWKCTEDDADNVYSKGPATIVATFDGQQSCPALILNQELMEKFRQTTTRINSVHRAQANLEEQEVALCMSQRSAKVQVDRAGAQFDGTRKRIYQAYQTGGPTDELREELMRRDDVYEKAMKKEKKIKAQHERLADQVRKAEREYFDLLKEIRDICSQAFVKASIPAQAGSRSNDEQASWLPTPPSSSTASGGGSAAMEVTPQSERKNFNSFNTGIPAQPVSAREQRGNDDHNPLEGPKTTACAKDPVDLIRDVSEQLKAKGLDVATAHHDLVEHQGSFAVQFEKYAREKGQQKDELASEFAPVFLKRGRSIYRNLSRAQQTYTATRQAAVEAGIPLEMDLSFHWESNSDEGIINESPISRPIEDTYDRKRILDWIEDPDRPAKHKRRTRPEPNEAPQLFDYVPVQPADSLSVTEECPAIRHKLQSWNRRCELRRRSVEARSMKRRNST